MQFSGETNNQDIVSMSRDLVKANSKSFETKAITRYSNQALRLIWSWIFLVFGAWVFDDSNQTDIAEATTNVNSGDARFTFPIDSAHIQAVEWKDLQGNWHRIHPTTLEEIEEICAEGQYMTTPGNPLKYRLVANGIKVYPAFNFTQDDSLKIFFSRDIVAFTVNSTTQVPGFPAQYHEAVPTFNALQFAKINILKNAVSLQKDWDGNEDVTGKEGGYKLAIKKYFANRYRQMFPPKIRNPRDITSDYI